MTKDGLPKVGPWAADKLQRLGKYLAAYTTIMANQKWADGFIFVDAFAGAGRAVVRGPKPAKPSSTALLDFETPDEERDQNLERVLDGSPAVALGVEPPFTEYVFLERDPERVGRLERLREEFPDRTICIQQGDSNEFLRNEFVASYDWRTWRAVVFLDPFGMQVPWNTLTVLATTKGIEVLINFPVNMAIQRLLKRSAKFTDKERKKLDDYFGDPGWYNLLYTSEGLFGPQVGKAKDSGTLLMSWYRDRLRATFGFASAAYLVSATDGHPLYYLIHAGPNETGVKIAGEVLKAGTPITAARRARSKK